MYLRTMILLKFILIAHSPIALRPAAAEDDVMATPVEIFTGAYFQPIPEIFTYTSSLPLIYKIPFKTDIDFPKPPSNVNVCRSPLNNNQDTCQMQNNLARMQTLIAEQMNNEQQVFQDVTQRSKRSLSFVGSFFKWCCDMATQSEIADVVDNERDITDHTNLLVDEVGLDHRDLVTTTENFNNFTQHVQNLAGKIHDSVRLLQNEINSLENTTGGALQSQLFSLTQQTMIDVYFNYYHDNLRDARKSCESKLLPTSLIARSTLRRDLRSLQDSLYNKSLFLAIPPEDHLHLYYKVPITSCKFFSNDILVIVKIPLSRFSSRPSVFRNIPVPLLWKDKLCYMSQKDVIIAKTTDLTQIVHQEYRHCNEITFPLCKLPRTSATSDISHGCIANIIQGSKAETLKNTCSFICQERPQTPIITELLPNKFLITNILNQTYIRCPNKQDTLLPVNKSGTLEIALPCSCSIHQIITSQTNITLIQDIKPCDSKDHNSSSVTHLLPLSWSILHSLSILPLEENTRHKFDNTHGIIDENWNFTTTVFHTHDLIKEDILKHFKLKHEMGDVINNQQLIMYILIGWVAILTVALLITLYLVHILYIKIPPTLPPRY